jgi:hypothetical protein
MTAMTKKYKTNILFPRASALQGIGSIFNVAGNYFDFNYSKSGEEADQKAIEDDWGVIGDDILAIEKKVRQKLQLYIK